MTELWQGGNLYLPGDLVQPISAPAAASSAITNPSFDSGATGWTLPGGATVVGTGGYSTPSRLEFTGTAGNLRAVNTRVAVNPGTTITASAAYQQGAADAGQNPARTVLVWYDAALAEITAAESLGNIISSGSNSAWATSSVTGVAPATAAHVAVGFRTTRTNAATSYVDHFVWDLTSTAIPAGLIYKAVQPAAGTSGSTEPVWPTTLGLTVVDNQVIWEAVQTSRVVWRAAPILKSGAVEPVWPTEIGAMVADGTIGWKCVGRHVSDPKCPQTKEVVIAASKVYAADNDIIKYSATVNPLDWSTANDAGYLPYGLQLYGSNPVAALGLYRSNLVAFNAQGFQMWQIDEDPANAALLDALPVGSTKHKALVPVNNDLFFLSSLGVRTVGISGGSTNLAAGDVGLPIDPLVQEAMRVATANNSKVLSTYYPGAGQYWLAFSGYPAPNSTIFVHTRNQVGQVGAWGRYVFPFPVDGFTQLGDSLYIRSGDDVLKVTEGALTDYGNDARAVGFSGVVQWPYLDFGSPGNNKLLIGFDIVGTGTPTIEVGYNQNSPSTFTTAFTVPDDTVPGMIIPLGIMAPSMSARITYVAGQKWQFKAMNLYLNDMRPGS